MTIQKQQVDFILLHFPQDFQDQELVCCNERRRLSPQTEHLSAQHSFYLSDIVNYLSGLEQSFLHKRIMEKAKLIINNKKYTLVK